MITESTPTKSEFDKAFFRLFKDGDYTAMADYSGHTPEYASQLHNPMGERKSNLYRAFRDLRAVWNRCPQRGERALQLFVDLVQSGLPEKTGDPDTERRRLVQEIDEWELAEMEHATDQRCLDELADVVARAESLIAAKRADLLRRSMADAVEKRRNGSK